MNKVNFNIETTAGIKSFLQPTLNGYFLHLRPLKSEDFDSMFAAASDPLIWEQHPNPLRFQKEGFVKYFDTCMESNGALAIIDKETHQIIGCSRYYEFNPELSEVIIGGTFLTKSYWGGKFNSELKNLMLNHAFHYVNKVIFNAGESNFRSQRALQKIGAKYIREEQREVPNGLSQRKLFFEIRKDQLRLVEIGIEYANLVQDIFNSSPNYFRRVDGSDPLPHTGKKEIEDIPPKRGPTYKKVPALIYRGSTPVGYADLHINHPKEGTAYLGLLILKESLQGQGLGQNAYSAIEDTLQKRYKIRNILLGVSDKNQVQVYWEKMGFKPNGFTYKWQGERVESLVTEMEKSLERQVLFATRN